MTSDNKNIIDLDSARKKQKAEKQKERIKSIFSGGQKGPDGSKKGHKNPNDPNKLDIWKWIQLFAALFLTAMLMRSCGFF